MHFSTVSVHWLISALTATCSNVPSSSGMVTANGSSVPIRTVVRKVNRNRHHSGLHRWIRKRRNRKRKRGNRCPFVTTETMPREKRVS
uniref:Putative secreted protein n=1 Tax=Anopheles marajoara TaxID=58244 RepID=A0A2M4CAC5_9DIPT